MKWSHARRLAISLPLAILAAIAMVAINEVGYQQSNRALQELAHRQTIRNTINLAMQNMLDAETGLRGFLLTNDEKYLEPYSKAVSSINTNTDLLADFYKSVENDGAFNNLTRQISQKIAEMELSLRLFREGNEEAWRFVMFTDKGKQNMDAIRSLTQELLNKNSEAITSIKTDVERALWISRLGIATVTVVALLAFYMYLRQAHTVEDVHKREQKIQNEERSRLEELVKERTATLTELANHLQQVREDERGHLARELHDELGSLLTAAKLDVARLKSRIDMTSPEVADRVMHLTETLNNGIALKRRIIEDLRPSSLSNLGLTTSLEILTREFATRSSIEIDSSLEQVDIPEATQLTVYRIIQESLTNIGKYANASKVLVSVHNYPTYVAVQIQDNGSGFDMKSVKPNSHGLAGMKHRVEAAGGRLSVTSNIGEGTTVSAVIPTNTK